MECIDCVRDLVMTTKMASVGYQGFSSMYTHNYQIAKNLKNLKMCKKVTSGSKNLACFNCEYLIGNVIRRVSVGRGTFSDVDNEGIVLAFQGRELLWL